jgi:hypothetical protein
MRRAPHYAGHKCNVLSGVLKLRHVFVAVSWTRGVERRGVDADGEQPASPVEKMLDKPGYILLQKRNCSQSMSFPVPGSCLNHEPAFGQVQLPLALGVKMLPL